MSLHQRMDKEIVVHLHNGVLLSVKNDEIMKFEGKWMVLEKKIILSEVTQAQNGKHDMYSLMSGY